MQISDLILEVANLVEEMTYSDLTGVAMVKAKDIINLVRTSN